jgi:AraC-like DNA-binding protein
MLTRTRIGAGIAAGALLIVAAASGGLLPTPGPVEAARPGSTIQEQIGQVPPPKPSRPGRPEGAPDPAQRRQRHEEFRNRVAANLGVSPERLTQAFRQARIDMINQAVQEGRLSREQADRIIQRINSGQGPGRPGGPGVGVGRGAAVEAAAQAVGMTREQLGAELRSGKSLAEVAQARNVSREELKSRILAGLKARLDAAVARGGLTAERAQQIADRMAAQLDRLIDFKPGQR